MHFKAIFCLFWNPFTNLIRRHFWQYTRSGQVCCGFHSKMDTWFNSDWQTWKRTCRDNRNLTIWIMIWSRTGSNASVLKINRKNWVSNMSAKRIWYHMMWTVRASKKYSAYADEAKRKMRKIKESIPLSKIMKTPMTSLTVNDVINGRS